MSDAGTDSDADSDADTDTNADTGSDSDADADTDTDSATDTDTDAEGDFAGLDRTAEAKLRIASYNVYFSSVFPEDDGDPPGGIDRVDSFIRIVNAIDADILALQEVFHFKGAFMNKTPEGILGHMEAITGESWYLAHDYEWIPEDPPDGTTGTGGRFIFSRYPILWQDYFNNRINAALFDLPPAVSDKDVLVVNIHYSNDSQADATGAFVANVAAGNIAGIPSDAMIMVCGDFNNQEGGVRYNAVANSIPNLVNLRPYHLGWPEPNFTTIGSTFFDNDLNPIDIYTRINDKTGDIIRKAIDFMLWRSDRLRAKSAYILNPLIMDQAALGTYGLHRVDTALKPEKGITLAVRADHWPYFADFYDPNGATGNNKETITTSGTDTAPISGSHYPKRHDITQRSSDSFETATLKTFDDRGRTASKTPTSM